MAKIIPRPHAPCQGGSTLRYSQTSLTIPAVILIWHTQQDIRAKGKTIAYQEQLFNIFATYLANNTNDGYMMLDHNTETIQYVSPNVKRVFGAKAQAMEIGIPADFCAVSSA